jgi:hypothetical protein
VSLQALPRLAARRTTTFAGRWPGAESRTVDPDNRPGGDCAHSSDRRHSALPANQAKAIGGSPAHPSKPGRGRCSPVRALRTADGEGSCPRRIDHRGDGYPSGDQLGRCACTNFDRSLQPPGRGCRRHLSRGRFRTVGGDSGSSRPSRPTVRWSEAQRRLRNGTKKSAGRRLPCGSIGAQPGRDLACSPDPWPSRQREHPLR